jgi:hypothetical protein
MTRLYFFKLFFLFLFISMIGHPAKSQDEKLKAIFVYNFTKYVNWPHKSTSFIITIIGKSPISSEIMSIASKKTVGSSPIEVKNVSTPEEITESNIVYIPASKTSVLPAIKQKSVEQHFLIITEKPDACKTGSCINFIVKDGKLSFEISKANLDNYGLGVSSDLLKLGTVIND